MPNMIELLPEMERTMLGRPKEFDVEKALDTAMRVFWSKGYYQTSVQDLVEAMGINRGSLYDTFGDKRDLFLAVFDRYTEKVKKESLEQLKQSGSALQLLKKYFNKRFRLIEEYGVKPGCLVTNAVVEMAVYDDEIRKRVHRYWGIGEDAFCAMLDRAKEEGEFESRFSSRALARYLVNFAIGLSITSRAGFSNKFNKEVFEVGLSIFDEAPELQQIVAD